MREGSIWHSSPPTHLPVEAAVAPASWLGSWPVADAWAPVHVQQNEANPSCNVLLLLSASWSVATYVHAGLHTHNK